MAKLTERLTQTQCDQAEIKAKEYQLSDGGGLYLITRPNAKKFFNLIVYRGGKRYSNKIGDLNEITLKEARILAKRKKQEIEAIPLNTKANNLRITFKEVFSKWIAQKAKSTEPKTIARWEYYNKAFFKDFEHKKMRDIGTADIIHALDDYIQEQRKESFLKALSAIKQVFDFSILLEYCETNPTNAIAKSANLKSIFANVRVKHRSFLSSIDEVKELKERIILSNATPSLKRLALFTLYNVTRPSEARLARWGEIDFKRGVWTIPAQRMKAREAHSITLSNQMLKMLTIISTHKHSQKDLIFQSLTLKEYSQNALNAMLKKLGYTSDILQPHGLRATFATIMNELQDKHGLSDNIIQACLAHKIGNSIARAYNHATYTKQKAKLYQFWADLLGDIS